MKKSRGHARSSLSLSREYFDGELKTMMRVCTKKNFMNKHGGSVNGRSAAHELEVCLDVWELRSADDSSLTGGALTANPNHSPSLSLYRSTPPLSCPVSSLQQQGQTQRRRRMGGGGFSIQAERCVDISLTVNTHTRTCR